MSDHWDSMDCSPSSSSRQEYWSVLPFPSPGHLSNPGIEPVSLTQWILHCWATGDRMPWPTTGWTSSSITSWLIDGETMETVTDFILGGAKINVDVDCSHEIKRRLLLGRKAMTNLDSILESRYITLPTKVCLVKANSFSSSHVWMWELGYKESWVSKNWCFWTVVLEKTLETPLDCKEIQLSILKEISPEDHDAGKDWRQKEKGTTEDEMVGWHHWLDGHEFEQALGVGDGQGSLECYSPWGHKELDTTERLNWTEPSGKPQGRE